ncbi:hypothetical protein Celaphus_00012204 [Cervus elaphus hippelaphus]|uniref:Hyaluronidase n=1 Tax=Cervus elaphus hippelaphus TaxID=46360 RepID=A0A212CLM6_CEREH|nr:hypothetical protein Celaphus_00012204 [Cervus elaphus hippelaphus]
MQCQHFFNVDLNLQLFNIISNLLETQSGSTIAIIYPNGLGNHHPDWSEMKVKTVAQKEFEMAGKSTMNATLTLALEMRSKCLWGFYLYPDCYNYDYRINPQTYIDKCPIKVYVTIMGEVFEKQLTLPPVSICLKVAVRINKLKTIKNMKDGFVCHCCYYHGWCRDSCEQHSSDVLRGKNKAPVANFK